MWSGWCSWQSDLPPPEQRLWRRRHGLQLPLHPQQVLGWAVLAALGAATFGLLLPALRADLRAFAAPVMSTLFAMHAASHALALLTDPAEDVLRDGGYAVKVGTRTDFFSIKSNFCFKGFLKV